MVLWLKTCEEMLEDMRAMDPRNVKTNELTTRRLDSNEGIIIEMVTLLGMLIQDFQKRSRDDCPSNVMAYPREVEQCCAATSKSGTQLEKQSE